MRLAALYGETDPVLAKNFAKRRSANMVAAGSGAARAVAGAAGVRGSDAGGGEILTSPDGERIAMVEIGGWDTHVNQAGAVLAAVEQSAHAGCGIAALKAGWGRCGRIRRSSSSPSSAHVGAERYPGYRPRHRERGVRVGRAVKGRPRAGGLAGTEARRAVSGPRPEADDGLPHHRDGRAARSYGLAGRRLAAVFPSSAVIARTDSLVRG